MCGLGHNKPNECKKNKCSSGVFGLIHTGDDPSGGNSDESSIVDLDKVSNDVQEILFVVTIADFEARKQNFGQVRNTQIRLLDNLKNEEVAKSNKNQNLAA